MMIDVGMNGRISDGSIISYNKFENILKNKLLNISEPDLLTNISYKLSNLFITANAFAMIKNFIKPYNLRNLRKEQIIFNYRLNQVRRIVDNAFGIWNLRFGIFQRVI